MKTAISIPDHLFQEADRYAKSHGFSRSQLYARAVEQFLKQHPTDHITRQLNEVYSSVSAELDETLSSMQLDYIEQEEW